MQDVQLCAFFGDIIEDLWISTQWLKIRLMCCFYFLKYAI